MYIIYSDYSIVSIVYSEYSIMYIIYSDYSIVSIVYSEYSIVTIDFCLSYLCGIRITYTILLKRCASCVTNGSSIYCLYYP